MDHEAVTPVFTDGSGPLFPLQPAEPFDFEYTGFASSGNGDPMPLGGAMPFMPYTGMPMQRNWGMSNQMGPPAGQPLSSEDIFAALENYQGEANELQGAGLFGLDLGDFFSQVGPGEVSKGTEKLRLRVSDKLLIVWLIRLREGSPSDSVGLSGMKGRMADRCFVCFVTSLM